MPNLLEAQSITKLYGMRPVLKGVSLQVTQGEFVCLLGANGAGKTTFLRILATLARPNSGTLHINGVDALKDPNLARAHLGVVSHHSLIYPDLSAIENLQFYGSLYDLPRETVIGVRDRLSVRPALTQEGGTSSHIETVLRQVNLWTRATDPARTYSRGMLQRLTIARAILHDPPLLLLDEPYTGLDQASAASLSGLLREVALSGRAVVMTTHEMGRGLEGVTRFVRVERGTLNAEPTVNTVGREANGELGMRI